jgi:hypothetical protein
MMLAKAGEDRSSAQARERIVGLILRREERMMQPGEMLAGTGGGGKGNKG